MKQVSCLTLDQLKKLMHFRPTLVDTAAHFNCSEDTISRFIKKSEGLSFFEFREMHFGSTRMRLRAKALQMALSGDRHIMIFLLKNYCGLKDQPEVYLEQNNVELEFVCDE